MADASFREKGNADDVEKQSADESFGREDSRKESFLTWNALTRKLVTWGVEANGILPVPAEERTDTGYHKIFFVWFTANFNILTFSSGSLGTVVYGLGVRDACLVILFFNMLCSIFPAYFTTWGPRLGMRQMVHARYSFGYYGVILPCIFNLVCAVGFCILSAILGGQALASVADGGLSWTVGIVITVVISLLVSFCGYTVLNWFERVAWIPILVVFVVALGVGGRHLSDPPPPEPASAATVLSFASVIAGYVITWSPSCSDYSLYFRPEVSRWKIFIYAYLGFLLSTVPVMSLGAAVAANAPLVPDWQTGYENGDVGGLIEAMLHPAGGFGKLLTVLVSLSVIGNMAVSLYSFCFSVQTFIPMLARVPRYVFSVLAAALVVVPLAIVGSTRFYTTLTDFLGLIGYYASAFVAVVLVEHVVFRGNSLAEGYDRSQWNRSSQLPTGVSAILAVVLCFGVVVPCMDQVWFVGPVARAGAGDIGFEVAFVLAAILYTVFRGIEVWVFKTHRI